MKYLQSNKVLLIVELMQLLIVLGKSQDTLITRTTFHVLHNSNNWCLEYFCSSFSGRGSYSDVYDFLLEVLQLKGRLLSFTSWPNSSKEIPKKHVTVEKVPNNVLYRLTSFQESAQWQDSNNKKLCYRSLSMHKLISQLDIKGTRLIMNTEICLSCDHC